MLIAIFSKNFGGRVARLQVVSDIVIQYMRLNKEYACMLASHAVE